MGRRDRRTQYRIVVDGEVASHFGDVFADVAIEPGQGVSTLVGTVRDQAELLGMLELLAGLGHEIVSVRRLD